MSNTDKTLAAPAVTGTGKAHRSVTVACKIPNGLTLQLCEERRSTETAQGTTRDVVTYSKVGDVIIVAGPAYPNGSTPKGFKRRPDDADGFALTHKVPAEFWEKWIAQNADADYVRSGMIFAYPDIESVAAKAADMSRIRSGFEPVNPDGDSRVPATMAGGLTQITTAEEWTGSRDAAR